MIDIDAFYDFQELTAKLETLAESDVIDLTSIGESPEGRDLWCATVAGPGGQHDPDDRPALFVTANMHAREYAGSWTALHLLDRLAEGYGTDDQLTSLLDDRTFYVIPRVCPDGADFVLETRTRQCRSRFVDIDPDEVSEPNTILPEDITGDGRILAMRWPAEDGNYVVPEEEPRLTLSRSADDTEGTFYRKTVEGRVVNYDGGSPSAVNMRSDFNRNFPSETWRPFNWVGHGDYPLSEPETRALADFVLAHPNIVCVTDLHCGNPAIFYPEGVQGNDVEHPEDARLFRRLGERGEEITGFPYLEGYYEASGGDPYTLNGSFKDWLYERIGVPAFTVEHGMLFNSLGFDTSDLAMDSDEHSRQTGEALLEYHDQHPDRSVFFDWQSVDHPELGEVEVGGWDWAIWSCPAVEDMPMIAADVTDWLLEVAAWAPDVEIDAAAQPLGDNLHRVTATVRNRGRMATYVTQSGQDSTQDDPPILTVDCGELVSGRPRYDVGHLSSQGDGERYEWVVRGSDPIRLTLDGARGVHAETTVSLEE